MPCIFNSFSNICLRTKKKACHYKSSIICHFCLSDPIILNSNPYLSYSVSSKVSEPQVIADEYLVFCVPVLVYGARSHKHQIKEK